MAVNGRPEVELGRADLEVEGGVVQVRQREVEQADGAGGIDPIERDAAVAARGHESNLSAGVASAHAEVVSPVLRGQLCAACAGDDQAGCGAVCVWRRRLHDCWRGEGGKGDAMVRRVVLTPTRALGVLVNLGADIGAMVQRTCCWQYVGRHQQAGFERLEQDALARRCQRVEGLTQPGGGSRLQGIPQIQSQPRYCSLHQRQH